MPTCRHFMRIWLRHIGTICYCLIFTICHLLKSQRDHMHSCVFSIAEIFKNPVVVSAACQVWKRIFKINVINSRLLFSKVQITRLIYLWYQIFQLFNTIPIIVNNYIHMYNLLDFFVVCLQRSATSIDIFIVLFANATANEDRE